jgi:hypothetical protein
MDFRSWMMTRLAMDLWKRIPLSLSSLGRWAGYGVALSLLACAGSPPMPGENHLRYAEQHGYVTTLPELEQGRSLFLQKCDRCHFQPRIKRRGPEKWPAIMDKMRLKAELSSRQDTLIRTYLMVASGNLRDSLATLKAPKVQ